ncbi:hypothetical protein [Clostridium sp. YIM B02569]|uniref:hypothetical protein n=1 Tax=Clostridium sp. YIM B02569 TaxID=2911967 RepID=UPI001EECA6F8|nr:hypothetical protein [Clostridium sp. YIM B02569]
MKELRRTQLLSLKRSSGIDFLNQASEKKLIYNHASTEKVAQRQTCVIVAVANNVRNVGLQTVIGPVMNIQSRNALNLTATRMSATVAAQSLRAPMKRAIIKLKLQIQSIRNY